MSWDDSTYNWSEMQQEATIVLEGEFPVVVVKADAVKTQNGKDMIKAKFKVESGPRAGRALFSNFVISPESPGAMRMFFTQLAVFGLDNAFFASIQGQPPSAIAQALDGRKAIAIIGKGVWQGAEREEIKGYKPALGGHGGGTFVAGLGGSIGGASAGLGSATSGSVSSSSPFPQPSPSAYSSSVESSAPEAPEAPEAVERPAVTEPSTAPPPVPAF